MNKTNREAREFTAGLLRRMETISGIERVQLLLAPAYTALEAVKELAGEKIWIGAQNMHWADHGPYTGEISAPMLKELELDFVELGHAERRRYFGETDEEVNRKVVAALAFGLKPLICVGESLEQRDSAAGCEIVACQAAMALKGVSGIDSDKIMIAYEPWWSINEESGAADPGYVKTIRIAITAALEGVFAQGAAQSIPVIYGGDVNPNNAGDLLASGGIDGLFVGRAAWQLEGLVEVIRIAAREAFAIK
jgi:triosephosphate isomerase